MSSYFVRIEIVMGNLIDIAGKRFGFWIVLESAEKNNKNQTQWLCECDCGTKKIITSNSLRTGNSTSCGCNHTPDLTNVRFGNLNVIKLDDSKPKGRRFWLCKCDCNNLISITTNKLRSNLITSCGCKDAGSTIEQASYATISVIIAQITLSAIDIIGKSGIEIKPNLTMMITTAATAAVIVSIFNKDLKLKNLGKYISNDKICDSIRI